MMKRIYISSLSLLWLLVACDPQSSQTNQTNQLPESATKPSGNVANCPKPSVVEVKASEEEGDLYGGWDFNIRKIVPKKDVIKFQTQHYDFVFCRGDSSWTVQPGTWVSEIPTNQTTEESLTQLANPKYQTIEVEGASYQYRVLLEPNPFPDFTEQPEKVIFELIVPESGEPQQQILYTLEQLQAAQIGSDLGLPRVTSANVVGNRIFWSVAAEQGEGFSGVATVVSYNPQNQKFAVIQPEKIQGVQITDIAISGTAKNPVLWMGTQYSAEGSPYIPAMGLVAYRPDLENLNSGTLNTFHIRNSPMVGAIPHRLLREGESLWVGTGNGICQVDWKTADSNDSWSCWRVTTMAKVPSQSPPLYPSLLSKDAIATIELETVEVLWWSPLSYDTRVGRYEVRYEPGLTATLEQQGLLREETPPPDWLAPAYWAGNNWHWQGERFVRGFDEVSLDYFGGGPSGIASNQFGFDPNRPSDTYAIRGDLELMEISEDSTTVKYFSAWVEDDSLTPYVAIEPLELPQKSLPNPL